MITVIDPDKPLRTANWQATRAHRAHMARWHQRLFHNMVIIMGSSTGRDYAKHVNESNVESVIEIEGERAGCRKSCRLCPDVRESDVDKSAKLQIEESGGASQDQTEPTATG